MRCTSLLGLLFAAGALAVPAALIFEPATNPLKSAIAPADVRGCGYFRNGKDIFTMDGDNKCYSIGNAEIQSYVIAEGCTCTFFK
jgi:hypothetical protein